MENFDLIPDMSVQTRTCVYCKRKTMAPCGSSQEAQNCSARMYALAEIANNKNHPGRLRASVAMQVPELFSVDDVLAPFQ